MMENAVYSVLSPEGFASILWKDSKRANEAAEIMRLTAEDLQQLGMIEDVIREPRCYTEETMEPVMKVLDEKIAQFLQQYQACSREELLQKRYERFRNM